MSDDQAIKSKITAAGVALDAAMREAASATRRLTAALGNSR